jgi:hypothetical protein
MIDKGKKFSRLSKVSTKSPIHFLYKSTKQQTPQINFKNHLVYRKGNYSLTLE